MDMYQQQRENMVRMQLMARDIQNPHVLQAMRTVPRELFVPPSLAAQAYEDRALPIQQDQTISQPYIVALMVQSLHLQPHSRVLEIGAGSGYAAAVLSQNAKEVYSLERHACLVPLAQARCRSLGYLNVHIAHGDGTRGWPEHAPYDGIAVAAGAAVVPQTLLEQLAVGGRLVMPVGAHETQQLLCIHRVNATSYATQDLGRVQFVPLITEPAPVEECAIT